MPLGDVQAQTVSAFSSASTIYSHSHARKRNGMLAKNDHEEMRTRLNWSTNMPLNYCTWAALLLCLGAPIILLLNSRWSVTSSFSQATNDDRVKELNHQWHPFLRSIANANSSIRSVCCKCTFTLLEGKKRMVSHAKPLAHIKTFLLKTPTASFVTVQFIISNYILFNSAQFH